LLIFDKLEIDFGPIKLIVLSKNTYCVGRNYGGRGIFTQGQIHPCSRQIHAAVGKRVTKTFFFFGLSEFGLTNRLFL
jgi:hypothetical protein